ncbi:MAG: MgtC/SapB family protein, partial [Cyanobacteria bacterium P01_A01_bin.17]
MTWTDFALRLGIALVLGGAIGIERQWRQTKAVMKTNVLVCLGASMFVMMSVMNPSDSSPTRVAAQIVSGVGFLGGGIILRDGASVRGLNTAATLWCSAAIGTLIGGGFLFHAYIGTTMVVVANLVLRPVIDQIKYKPRSKRQVHTNYRCSIVCKQQHEEEIQALLLEFVNDKAIMINSVEGQSLASLGKPGQTILEVELTTQSRNDYLLEEITEMLRRFQIEGRSVRFVKAVKNPYNKGGGALEYM